MNADRRIVIRDGLIVDGTGAKPFTGDVAVMGGTIVGVGAVAPQPGDDVIDARGCLVTPGFVDVHTHYDAQAIWADRLEPSSQHGVTTVVIGNCGVGFAPCRREDQVKLVALMEAVEDIPGVAMAEGLTWSWETFPEYADAVAGRPHDIDIGAYLPHSPLRVYVMGDRGVAREPANAEDLARMRALAREAAAAGALGCATSRTFFHRTLTGDNIPTFAAAEAELATMMAGFADAGAGVLQIVTDSSGSADWNDEFDLIERVATQTGRPATFSCSANPQQDILMARLTRANARGLTLTGQVLPRPAGMVLSHALSWNPFSFCPGYAALRPLPLARRLERLRDPEVRARLLAEAVDFKVPLARRTRDWEAMFVLGDPPDYEPPREASIAALAARAQVSPVEFAYDFLLEADGENKLFAAMSNYTNGSLDAIVDLLNHPNIVFGLGDGGAHYGLVCDASYPTSVLTHWVRDRADDRIDLAHAVATLSRRPAETVGLLDRGVLAPGYRADLNVIDHARLRLLAPTIAHDLPAGATRLAQGADGYRLTMVSGVVTRSDGHPTGALPGRFIRGPQAPPAAASAPSSPLREVLG